MVNTHCPTLSQLCPTPRAHLTCAEIQRYQNSVLDHKSSPGTRDLCVPLSNFILFYVRPQSNLEMRDHLSAFQEHGIHLDTFLQYYPHRWVLPTCSGTSRYRDRAPKRPHLASPSPSIRQLFMERGALQITLTHTSSLTSNKPSKTIQPLLTNLFPDLNPPFSKIAQVSLWGGSFTPYLTNPSAESLQSKVGNVDGYVHSSLD